MSCDIEATIDQRPINATIEGAIVNISGGAGGLIDGDYGDIAVSGAGTVWTIENMSENATVTTGTYVSNVNQDLLIKVRKSTAGTITKGQVVYIIGSSGTHLLVELARANVEATSAYTIGIAATNITNTAEGFVIQNGRLTGLSTVPTTTFADGDAIYLSETTAGGYRVGIPEAPNHGVFLGFVIRASNGGAGELDVRIQNYQELEELSDVYINNETVNDFLVRKATRWENTTPANVKTILAIDNVNNTSDLNKPISTATQIALDSKQNTLVSGTNIKTINNESILGSGNLTISGGGGSVAWGGITGTLSDQTDLQTALNGKQPLTTVLTNTTASFTIAQETKLSGIQAGAEVNVNADWNAVSGDAQILNKPSIPTQYTDELAQDAVGNIFTDTTSIDLIYDDNGNTISAQREALTGAITASKNSNTTALGSFTVSQLNTALSDGDVATGGGTATGTNTGDQNIFSTIAVSGQSNVVADSTFDTLTLVAGSNITLTTNATNDEITIASTGGGGGGGFTYPQLLSMISLKV